MRKILFALVLLAFSKASFAQKSVAITIDDIPNVHIVEKDGSSRLLRRLDSLQIPVAIFINEANLNKTSAAKQNENLLKSWLLNKNVTPGNHSFSHPNYGEVGFEAFSEDVVKGEKLTREIIGKSGKKLEYFRFPFNAMGKDSAAHLRMEKFLRDKGYRSIPFTVENEDWMYTQLYERALKDRNQTLSDSIGEQYVGSCIRLFAYVDSLSTAMFGREIKHIYLCHDNQLNTDYLPKLIKGLEQRSYQMVSLADALEDPAYQSKDFYFGNAGFSWIYRWIKDPVKRKAAMRAEPVNSGIQRAFEEMNKAK
ncbi:polysaccharide deacetylase family protein [Dyadobacter crusticola]|uniref:polysaccharide deacetylase family protein n=1 Tax=Dyadobacter crusticola TaxID=292407 RepID=UPI0004E27389|nr:polysaccharide deacetylase family protein [Dyadobacter crusticola]